jgi:hypothetical protein
MNTKISGYKVQHVDMETGEIICETEGVTEIKDNVMTEKEKKRQDYIDSHVMNFNKDASFVKLYDEVVEMLFNKLDAKEFSLAIALCKYVSYEDCALREGGHGNGRIFTIKELSEKLNREYTRFSRTFKSLIKRGVIGKWSFETGNVETGEIEKKSGFIVNPYIYFRGVNVDKLVYEYFDRSGWKELLG